MRRLVARLGRVLGMIALLGCAGRTANACTGVKLKAKDGSLVYGRTMEFGVDLGSQPIVIPRRLALQGAGVEGKPGLAWQAKYAAIGMNAFGMNQIVEGSNEKGLAGGIFYMPNYAQYQSATAADQSRLLAPWELMTWILTKFASVEEVRSAIAEVRVVASPAPVLDFVPPAHYVVHDLSGKSLVIEYLRGELRLYDNPAGVITNAPDFAWHLANLNNYVSLKAMNSTPEKLGDVQLRPFGQGAGLFGMPGDFTPPSRFVRAFLLGHNALDGADGEAAAEQLFHVLDSFDIPRGSVADQVEGKPSFEYTSWTTANDMTNHVFYFHTVDNRRVRRIELMRLDLDADHVHEFRSPTKQDYDDLQPVAR